MKKNRLNSLFRKVLTLLTRKQRVLGLFVLLCSVMAAIFELLGVSVIVPLINALIEPTKLIENRYIKEVFSIFGTLTNDRIVFIVIVTVIVVYVTKNAYFIFNTWLKNKYAFMVQREISVTMMKKYINRGYSFFLKHNYSELRQGIDGDVRAVYHIINLGIQVFVQSMIVLMIGIYMLYTEWKLAIGAIVTGLLCIVLFLGFFRRTMTESGVKLRILSVKAEKTLEETLHGIKLVMLSHKEDFFVRKYSTEIARRNNADIIKTMGSEIPVYIIEAISITGIMLSLCTRILSVNNANEYVAVLGAFAIGMFRILPAIGKITSSVNGIISCIPNLDSVYDNFISCDNDIGRNSTFSNQEKTSFEKQIEFKEVSFKYDGNNKYVLSDLNLSIYKGCSVALVGESGAGKSTFADIMLGLLQPSSGGVYVDDVNMIYLPEEWWKCVGYIPQSIFLIDSSIRENVAYGMAISDIDDKRVKRALEKANILTFIESLPDGINTFVGDRGVRLSGGQRQRIGIARALYNEPDILIMDEATSALDNDTETAVMEAIDSLKGEMTMIIIAHRLTTIKNCEHIYEIRNGRVSEKKYEELNA